MSPLLFALVEHRWHQELAHVCRMMANRQQLGIPLGNHAVRAAAQVEHIGWWRSCWPLVGGGR
ncbi:hypothetical protein [Myxococcus eversor]|uniref:hypothetical protein n=1 Tax=Myxococcus eversor TaxID=2709661 RepID=UPI0013CF70D3|nr:hypothetical protein [Myxococcus eversor]